MSFCVCLVKRTFRDDIKMEGIQKTFKYARSGKLFRSHSGSSDLWTVRVGEGIIFFFGSGGIQLFNLVNFGCFENQVVEFFISKGIFLNFLELSIGITIFLDGKCSVFGIKISIIFYHSYSHHKKFLFHDFRTNFACFSLFCLFLILNLAFLPVSCEVKTLDFLKSK